MAGYGRFVDAPSEWDQLVDALAGASRRRAHAIGVRCSFRRRPQPSCPAGYTRWYLTLDGNGYRIAALARQLERDFPTIAEGYSGPGGGGAARRLARSFIAVWNDACVGDDGYPDRIGRASSTSRAGARWLWPVLNFPDDLKSSERLRVADEVMARFMTREIPPELAIEEIHTAVETVLKAATGGGRKWTQLLATAERLGLIEPSERTRLKEFNARYRVALKHDGLVVGELAAETTDVAINDLLWDSIEIADEVLDRMRRVE